jgi:putative PIN family toxin of toxin-antitoxin system
VTRLLLDASMLASATVAHLNSPSARLLRAAQDGKFEVVACERLLVELDRALSRRYFVERLTDTERAATTAIMRALAIVLPDPIEPQPILRDPRDDYLVALARAAAADAIVTGDRDLLDHDGLVNVDVSPAAVSSSGSLGNETYFGR